MKSLHVIHLKFDATLLDHTVFQFAPKCVPIYVVALYMGDGIVGRSVSIDKYTIMVA